MPLRSEAQRRFLWMKNPELALKFEHETPKAMKKKLPYHVNDTKGKKKGGKKK